MTGNRPVRRVGGAEITRDRRPDDGRVLRGLDRQAEVHRVEQRSLFELGKDHRPPSPARGRVGCPVDEPAPGGVAHRERPEGVVIVVEGDPDLFQVVDALDARARLARRLHRRQQQGNQDRDDRDDHQEFDQRKATDKTGDSHGSPSLGGPWGNADLERTGSQSQLELRLSLITSPDYRGCEILCQPSFMAFHGWDRNGPGRPDTGGCRRRTLPCRQQGVSSQRADREPAS